MATAPALGAVLIVVMNLDDRRVLFNALDAREFEAVYTAKDFYQALQFLQQAPRLDAAIVEFDGEAEEALAFVEAMTEEARLKDVMVLGVAGATPDGGAWGWSREAPRVRDWLRRPVLGDEAY